MDDTITQRRAYGRGFIETHPGGSVNTIAYRTYQVEGPAWVGGPPERAPGGGTPSGHGGESRPAFIEAGEVQVWALLGSDGEYDAVWALQETT